MRVQGHPGAAPQHLLVDAPAFVQDGRKSPAREHGLQGLEHLGLPARAPAPVLQQRKAGLPGAWLPVGLHHVQFVQPVAPQRAHLAQQGDGLLHAVFQQFCARNLAGIVALAQRQLPLGEEGFQRVQQLELVAQRQLDVDALHALGVLAQTVQRDDHVLVDLEGVGVAGNGRSALAVKPELLARVSAHGHKALAAARVGQAHHLAGGARHGVGIVTHDVAHQHHLGQAAAARSLGTLALGGIAHGLEVAVVQVLQASQHGATGAAGFREHEVLDVHDAGHRVLRVAEELQAHRAGVRRHAVHDPARAGDQAVAAFLLHAGQPGQELVSDVLAQTFLAEQPAGDVQPLGALQLLAAGIEMAQLEAGQLHVVDLAQVVVQAHHLQPSGLGRDHAPGGQVVQRRAPQHRLLAASVHGDVAADAAGFGRGGVHREDEAGPLGGVGHALRHHTRLAGDGGYGAVQPGQLHHLHLAQGLELLGVDDRALPGQRHRATGVAGAAATRDDRQAQLDAALHQARHLGLGVGREHDEGHFHAPVGGVRHVRDAAQTVKLEVVFGRVTPQHTARGAAQVPHGAEVSGKPVHRRAGGCQQLLDQGVTRSVQFGRAALLHLRQAVVQRVDQHLAPLRVVQQVVFEVGVALHHPDVAQHLVQHACGAAGAALATQLLQQFPGTCAQQADHDLPVGERGVVVGNLAQTRCAFVRVHDSGQAGATGNLQRQRSVHLWLEALAYAACLAQTGATGCPCGMVGNATAVQHSQQCVGKRKPG